MYRYVTRDTVEETLIKIVNGMQEERIKGLHLRSDNAEKLVESGRHGFNEDELKELLKLHAPFIKIER